VTTAATDWAAVTAGTAAIVLAVLIVGCAIAMAFVNPDGKKHDDEHKPGDG
jgi:hypothetical protein